MELRHLRYFVTAAEEMHFGRAADRLNISRPAVGLQIRELEQELHTQLFERLAHGVRLTPAGTAFLGDARRILDEVLSAVEHAQCVARGEAGVLRVGHVRGLPHQVSRLIEMFCVRYPNVDVQAIELTTMEQWTALSKERIDVGIVYAAPSPTGLRCEVFHELLVTGAVLPVAHVLSRRSVFRCEDLGTFPCLMPPQDAVNVGLYVREFRARGLELKLARSQVTDVAVRFGLVAKGAGWLPATEPAREALLARTPGTKYRKWEDPPFRVPYGITWRASDHAPLVATFLGLAKELRAAPPVASLPPQPRGRRQVATVATNGLGAQAANGRRMRPRS